MIVTRPKHWIILACVFALSACEASRPRFEIDFDAYHGAVDRQADSHGALISKRAADVYELEYFRAQDHKAIAQSSNGTWSWASGQLSPEAAMDDALARCRERNGGNEANEPCLIININSFWITEFSSRR